MMIETLLATAAANPLAALRIRSETPDNFLQSIPTSLYLYIMKFVLGGPHSTSNLDDVTENRKYMSADADFNYVSRIEKISRFLTRLDALQQNPQFSNMHHFLALLGVETYDPQPTIEVGAKMFTATIPPHNARRALDFYMTLPEESKPNPHFIINERMMNIIAADNFKNKIMPSVTSCTAPIDLGPPFNQFCKEKSLYSGRGINVSIEYSSKSVSIKDESMEGFRLPFSGSSLVLNYAKERIKDFATDFENFLFVALDTHLEIYPLANRVTFVVGSPIRFDLQFWRIIYQGGVLYGDREPPGPSSLVNLNFAFPSSDPALIPKEPVGDKVIDPDFIPMYTVPHGPVRVHDLLGEWP